MNEHPLIEHSNGWSGQGLNYYFHFLIWMEKTPCREQKTVQIIFFTHFFLMIGTNNLSDIPLLKTSTFLITEIFHFVFGHDCSLKNLRYVYLLADVSSAS